MGQECGVAESPYTSQAAINLHCKLEGLVLNINICSAQQFYLWEYVKINECLSTKQYRQECSKNATCNTQKLETVCFYP